MIMTTNRVPFVYVICLIVLTFFPSCLDVETTSQVNSDGSVLRTITFEDDSASIYRGMFPVPIDSSWQKTIQRLDDKKFRLTTSKLFHDVNEMNAALKGAFGKTFQFQFEFEKHFQWFFTVYRFKEINLKYNQFETIPLTEFVSQDEIDNEREHEVENKPFATKGDSLALKAAESRFQEWTVRNLFEPIYAAFLEGARKINDPRLDPVVIERHKDTLYMCSEKSLEKGNIDTLRIIFARVLKNSLVDKVWRSNTKAFKEIGDKLNADFAGTYVTNIIMPGLITGSNAPAIEGNKATWRDFKDYAKYVGYTMWIESRQVNWWAVILTGTIILALLILMTFSMLRRNR